MRQNSLKPGSLFLLFWLAACSSAQDPFLGTYDVETTTDSTFKSQATVRVTKRTTVVVTAGNRDQLIFSFGPVDGGTCLLTGTAQSATAFSMDISGQGCATPAPDGGILYSQLEQGSGSIDASGNLAINQSGNLTLRVGLISLKGTFQQAVAGSRDGG